MEEIMEIRELINRFNMEHIKPIHRKGRKKIKIETLPINDKKKKELSKYWWSTNYKEEVNYIKNIDSLFNLRSVLLSFGGEETQLLMREPNLMDILSRAQLFIAKKGRVIYITDKGVYSGKNCLNIYRERRDIEDIHICKGYALSYDGIWKSHTWLVHINKKSSRPNIIETCVEKKAAYFGFVMTKNECENFCC